MTFPRATLAVAAALTLALSAQPASAGGHRKGAPIVMATPVYAAPATTVFAAPTTAVYAVPTTAVYAAPAYAAPVFAEAPVQAVYTPTVINAAPVQTSYATTTILAAPTATVVQPLVPVKLVRPRRFARYGY